MPFIPFGHSQVASSKEFTIKKWIPNSSNSQRWKSFDFATKVKHNPQGKSTAQKLTITWH